MTEIDKDVFKNCINVTNAEHCFHRCTSLVRIPQYLFTPMTKLNNVELCFKSCTNLLEVPSDLFDNCHKITKFKQCFCGGGYSGDASYSSIMKIKTELPAMWERQYNSKYNIETFQAYAKGCKSSPNYNTAWGMGWA